MPSQVIRRIETKFNDASKPVLVTNSDGKFWVEDPPNLVRLLPVRSEEAAEHIWADLVASVKSQTILGIPYGEARVSNRG